MLTGMGENDPFAVSRRTKGTPVSRRPLDRVLMLAASCISFKFSDDRRIPLASSGTVAVAMLGFVLAYLITGSGVERRLRAAPVAEGTACVKPDARCRSPSSVVCRQVRRFGRACQMPESLSAAQEWTTFPAFGPASSIIIPLAPVFRGQWRKRGTRRNAATRPASGHGSIWCASTAWQQGVIGSSMSPRPGKFFVREPGHRKLDVHFACFRRASSMIQKEITTQRPMSFRNPFHDRG